MVFIFLYAFVYKELLSPDCALKIVQLSPETLCDLMNNFEDRYSHGSA